MREWGIAHLPTCKSEQTHLILEYSPLQFSNKLQRACCWCNEYIHRFIDAYVAAAPLYAHYRLRVALTLPDAESCGCTNQTRAVGSLLTRLHFSAAPQIVASALAIQCIRTASRAQIASNIDESTMAIAEWEQHERAITHTHKQFNGP